MRFAIIACVCTGIAGGLFVLLEFWASRASRAARRHARRRKGAIG